MTMETCSVGRARPLSPTVCRAWRIGVAHDLKNVDPVTNVPLAARVCYNVAGLQFSFQTDTFQDILKYQAGGALGVGPLLSALCAFTWFTKVRPPPHSEHSRRLPFIRACALTVLCHYEYMRRSCMRSATLSRRSLRSVGCTARGRASSTASWCRSARGACCSSSRCKLFVSPSHRSWATAAHTSSGTRSRSAI